MEPLIDYAKRPVSH